jgi:hypothetical protein
MKRYMAAAVAGVVIGIWGAMPAAAQQVSSFEQLQLLVKPGDTIIVTDSAGTTTKGKIESLTRESLRLSANKIVREFAQKDARLIRQWKGDSLGNGAAIGAVVGAGLGLLSLVGCREAGGGCNAATGASMIAVMGALGTGVGVGIDALVISRHTIYKSPGTAALDRFQVKPLISGDKKGAALSFSF